MSPGDRSEQVGFLRDAIARIEGDGSLAPGFTDGKSARSRASLGAVARARPPAAWRARARRAARGGGGEPRRCGGGVRLRLGAGSTVRRPGRPGKKYRQRKRQRQTYRLDPRGRGAGRDRPALRAGARCAWDRRRTARGGVDRERAGQPLGDGRGVEKQGGRRRRRRSLAHQILRSRRLAPSGPRGTEKRHTRPAGAGRRDGQRTGDLVGCADAVRDQGGAEFGIDEPNFAFGRPAAAGARRLVGQARPHPRRPGPGGGIRLGKSLAPRLGSRRGMVL